MVLKYNCPQCSAAMSFDSKAGVLLCNSCGHKEVIAGYQEAFASYSPVSHTAFFEDEEARQYLCKKCGAALITDNHTSVTSCCFCGAPMTLGQRIAGDCAPVKMIPFSISRAEAAKAFQRWCKKIKFAPKDFPVSKKTKEVTGIYIPCQLFDLRGQGQAKLHCTKVRNIKEGKEIIREISHYSVYRKIDLTFRNIPVCASQHLPARLLEGLLPFDNSKMQDFQASALKGFAAEKCSKNAQKFLPQAQKRVKADMDRFIENTLQDYQNILFEDRDYQIGEICADYILLPVWIVNYSYGDEDYIFALNGQTGKSAGNPPVSLPKAASALAAVTFFAFLICRLLTVLLGGPLL